MSGLALLGQEMGLETSAKLLDEQRNFVPNELIAASANTLLDELFRWAEGLKAMRERK